MTDWQSSKAGRARSWPAYCSQPGAMSCGAPLVEAMPFVVSVPQLKARFEVGDDETILEAATAQGIPFPFSCHSGTCGTCKSRLVSGDVTLLDHYSKFTLTDKEREIGLILRLLRHSEEQLRSRTDSAKSDPSAQADLHGRCGTRRNARH